MSNLPQNPRVRPFPLPMKSYPMSMADAPVAHVMAMVMSPHGEADPIFGLLAEAEEMMDQLCADLLTDDPDHPRHANAFKVYKRLMAARALYARDEHRDAHDVSTGIALDHAAEE